MTSLTTSAVGRRVNTTNAPANPFGDNPSVFKDIVVNSNESSRYNARFWVVSPPDDPTVAPAGRPCVVIAGDSVVGRYARERGAQVPGRLVSSSKSWLSRGSGQLKGHETLTVAVALSSDRAEMNVTIYNKIEL